MTALAAYESALRVGSGCWLNSDDGARVELPLRRWLDAADDCDQRLLDSCSGPTLDVGCGPGRLTVALMKSGIDALGIDVSAEAVRLAKARGARVLRRDVFGRLPNAGAWKHVLLADGNIGIGGSPVRILQRAAELIGPGGSVLVEVDGPGLGMRRQMVRLEAHGHRGWIPWAQLGIDAVDDIADQSAMVVTQVVATATSRHFVEFKRSDNGSGPRRD